MDRARSQATRNDLVQLLRRASNAAAGAAQSEGRADDQRQRRRLREFTRLLDSMDDSTINDGLADLLQELLEKLPILSALNGPQRRSEHLHTIVFEHAQFGQLHGQIQ